MAVDLDHIRSHVGPGPSDDVLADLLEAALEAIDNRYGPEADACQEYLKPFGQWVRLGRRASAVASVKEGGTEVDESGYTLWPGGHYLRRIVDDVPLAWSGWVDVAYSPLSESMERARVTVALVDLDLNRHPGLAGITVGPWSEQYTQDDEAYGKARDAILASLRPRSVGVW